MAATRESGDLPVSMNVYGRGVPVGCVLAPAHSRSFQSQHPFRPAVRRNRSDPMRDLRITDTKRRAWLGLPTVGERIGIAAHRKPASQA